MADIKKELNDIKNAVYGREVRGAIHDGIKKINEESEGSRQIANNTKQRQDAVEQQFNTLLSEWSDDKPIDNAETIAARTNTKESKTYENLGKRLDEEYGKVTSQLAQIAINVKNFGATGDGQTDDTQAIQSAVDHVVALGGGRVYLPPGIYRVSDTIELDSNIEFFGAGAKLTTLFPDFLGKDVFQNIIRIPGTSEERKENVTLHNFGIDGSNVEFHETESRGLDPGQWARIQPRYVDNFKAYDMHYYHGSHLFHMHGCRNFTIERVTADYSFSIVHMVSTHGENIGGVINNLTGTRMACMVDFGGGGQDIVVSNVVGNGEGNFRSNEEAFDIGGAKNVKIINSILKNFRTGVLIKGEEGKPWDNISIENCRFEGFTHRGIDANPGDVRPFDLNTGTLILSNVQFVSDKLDVEEDTMGINIRETFGKFHFNDVLVNVNGNGVFVRGFTNLKFKNMDIESNGYGMFFESVALSPNRDFELDGITINTNQNGSAIEVIGCNSAKITNFKITNNSNYSIFLRNFGYLFMANGVIKDTYGSAIRLHYGKDHLANPDSLNGLNTHISNIDIIDWGIGSQYAVGLNFVLPSNVTGAYTGLHLTNCKFIQTGEKLSKTGVSWMNFSDNKITNSVVDGLLFYRITIPEAYTSNKGDNVIGENVYIR